MADNDTRPIVGILAENFPGERRVALVPNDIKRLARRARFLVEVGAGLEAGQPDDAYARAGAITTARGEVIATAHMLVAVRAPDDLSTYRPGTVLASLGGRDDHVVCTASVQGLVHLGLERLPRTTRAQAMDVLSSQAMIAGYAAAIEGARTLDVLLPMMTTAAGGVKPAKMIALGSGVAGLQAIATARRLGAIVHGFDVRYAAREQVESLGARFVWPREAQHMQEAQNGYASEQSADQQQALRRALDAVLSEMRLIISSAQIPGQSAPLLIDDKTISGLSPGTVIIDLAAETGGNTTQTKANETVTIAGVRILGPLNLPSLMAEDASRLLSGNVRALIEHLVSEDEGLVLRPNDPIVTALAGNGHTLRNAA